MKIATRPGLRPVAIVSSSRTPFVKSFTSYAGIGNQSMATAVVENLVQKTKASGMRLGEVALGAVMKNAEDWNLARETVLGTSLHHHTPGFDLQRACGTSLETSGLVSLKIASGQIEAGIAGGTDTNSDILGVLSRSLSQKLMRIQKSGDLISKAKILSSLSFGDFVPRFPNVTEPRTHLSMGEHTELMVKEWKISRESQDKWALESHQKAAKAQSEGFFDDLIMEFKGLKKDAFIRKDSSLESLGKLRPAFDKSENGTLTAGNSTPLTDGAAAVLLASEEEAGKHKWPILAYFVDIESSAVDFVKGEGLLIAPTIAVSRLLARHNLSFEDIDLFEIHEAFAGQVLCTLKAWEDPGYCKNVLGRDKALGSIDRSKINVHGSSLAVGHPFAATGARIVGSLAKTLNQRGRGLGLISICTAGGMGVAALIEK